MKKGSYDLGNKGLYFVVVVFVVAIMFLLASNAINKLNTRTLQESNKLADISVVTKTITCVSKESLGRTYFGDIDKIKFTDENLKSCLANDPFLTNGERILRGASLELQDKIIKTRQDLEEQYTNSYERVVLIDKKLEKIIIKVEKGVEL